MFIGTLVCETGDKVASSEAHDGGLAGAESYGGARRPAPESDDPGAGAQGAHDYRKGSCASSLPRSRKCLLPANWWKPLEELSAMNCRGAPLGKLSRVVWGVGSGQEKLHELGVKAARRKVLAQEKQEQEFQKKAQRLVKVKEQRNLARKAKREELMVLYESALQHAEELKQSQSSLLAPGYE
jgi:hypothetical protein